jgi:hypothetical protein
VQDYYAASKLSQEAPALHSQYAAREPKGFLFFPETTGLDGSRVVPLMEKPAPQLTETEKTVREAVIYGGRMSLKWTALLPLAMAVGYLLLIVYFKAKGGYKQVHLRGTAAAETGAAAADNQPS